MTGVADLSTPLETSTVTLTQLAQRVKGIQDALASLGVLDATGNDPYPNSVVLLLRGDGANDSTNIVDSSISPKAITVFGNTKISTDQSKYGGSSIYFDGSGDYIRATIPDGLGIGDFTLEFWLYPVANTGMIFNSRGGGGLGSDGIDISGSINVTTGGQVIFAATSLTLNTWIHIALVRKNNLMTRFVGGVIVGTSTVTNNFSNSIFSIGGSTAGNIGYLNGYIDCFRLSNIARYTNNFNPENQTYLNS